MPTSNVVLTDHQQKVIESLVRSGGYQNASEVMREGLRLVERREAEDAVKAAGIARSSGPRVAGPRGGAFPRCP